MFHIFGFIKEDGERFLMYWLRKLTPTTRHHGNLCSPVALNALTSNKTSVAVYYIWESLEGPLQSERQRSHDRCKTAQVVRKLIFLGALIAFFLFLFFLL